MEQRVAADAMPVFRVWAVHRQQQDDLTNLLPEWLAARVELESTQKLRTVFPERSRWHEWSLQTEPGGLSDVGRLSLLVQQTTHRVSAGGVDDFRRSWTDLGYNAIGEDGVVRCDLLQDASDPTVFVARKVFKSVDAMNLHEASEHFARWHGSTGSLLVTQQEQHLADSMQGGVGDGLYDTLLPRTSAFPFRSRWAA